MNMNATNPENPSAKYKPRKIDWDWRDSVESELTLLGVPRTISTVAVIDLRQTLDACAAGKLNPTQTANIMLTLVYDMYNKGLPY